jgi:ABC-type lipopolysaccharide export system ATPase subunit
MGFLDEQTPDGSRRGLDGSRRRRLTALLILSADRVAGIDDPLAGIDPTRMSASDV